MIDWNKTKELFDRGDLSGAKPKVVVVCDKCGVEGIKTIRTKSKVINNQISWECTKCVANRPEKKEKSKQGALKAWKDPKYRKTVSENSVKNWEDSDRAQKMSAFRNSSDFKERMIEINRAKVTPEFREKMSEIVSNRWKDPEYHQNATRKLSEASRKAWADPEYRDNMSNIMKSKWSNEVYRDKMVQAMKDKWTDEEHRTKMLCVFASDEFRNKMVKVNKEVWERPEYREKIAALRDSPEYREKLREACNTPEYKAKMALIRADSEYQTRASAAAKKTWEDPEFREKMLEIFNSPEYRKKMTLIHADPEYQARMSEISKKTWEDPEYQAKMAVIRSNQPKVSSIQTILYSILDDLEVKYYREHNSKADDPQCTIGPYNFDCVIPRKDKPDLLIECQGEYWHSLDGAIRNDKSKTSYIANNFPKEYELKCIWEHEFSNLNKVQELLKYWLGMAKLELIDFDFSNIEIKKSLPKDYKLLLSKYHYLPNAGRGGIAYGAYLEDKLIAVCVFSSPIRQNVASSLGYKDSEVRELSRLCIHPRYQKKNFASWFVSRCIKLLDHKFKYIVSYCDTTFNHNGATYKACNFTQDKEIRPDYWYVSPDGWVMHKKTLYGHAVKMKMKEKEYAELNMYRKAYGSKKLRFVFGR